MQVRCDRIISPRGEYLDSHPAVRVGDVYEVISITARPGRDTLVQIFTEKDGPSLWTSKMFTAILPEIEPHWQVSIDSGGVVHFGPPRFDVPGYWEAYYDGDADAECIFQEDFLDNLSE